ncbi:MAG: hypothetical protein QOK28_3096 [Actinomycetota bacterium]
MSAPRNKRRLEDLLPLGYFGLVVLLALLVLPTILRTPQTPPTQAAELSPDAPPDPEQQSLISSFSRGVSGTAGEGDGVGGGDSGATPTTIAGKAPPRACPFGVGNPPRQTFSYFSAPCAGPFTGKNGGATWKGVTANEVRVAIADPNGDHGTDGLVPDVPRPNESDADRTYRVFQQWFNSRYQFWGRRLQLAVINGDDSVDTSKQRAVAVSADENYHVFAADIGRYPSMEELARRQIISFGEQGDYFNGSWLADHRPYTWTTRADATLLMRLAGEFACKNLVGRVAEHAGGALASQKRVFGFLYQDNDGYRRSLPEFRDALAPCGGTVKVAIGFPGDGGSSADGNTVSSAVARMRAQGVTTVVASVDVLDSALVGSTATAQSWFPEWFVTGMGLLDENLDATLQDSAQWTHAFGIGAAPISDPQLNAGDVNPIIGMRAYHEIDPSGSPDFNITIRLFAQLEQIANGIQMAGPNLTPQTFEQGLMRMGPRVQDLPPWEVVGGFGTGDYSFADKVGILWWDPNAPNDTSTSGAYRWINGGKRYGLGQLPSSVPELFKTGASKRVDAK